MEPGATIEIPLTREIVPNVNRISAAVRAASGLNVFIRYLIDDKAVVQWVDLVHLFCDARAPQGDE
jgi:ureidoacrylate peracid hydrolase